MNLILLDSQDFSACGNATLSDQRYLQIRDTHRSAVGDRVKVGQVNGLMGTALIAALNDKHAILEDLRLDQQPPTKLPLRIILALPRPKMIRRIFRSIAELGVNELIIINSYKVEKSFWQSPAISPEKVREYLIDGLQQAKDTLLPSISFEPLFKPFVEDRLPNLIVDQQAFIAHPGLGKPCPQPFNQPLTLAIGPEGGFTPYEVDKLTTAGFEGINLGSRILKVENALTVLTAKLYS